MATETEVRDHARLLLMEQRDAGERSLIALVRDMQAEFPEMTVTHLVPIWRDYCGMDHLRPRRDLDTDRVTNP